MNLRGFKKLLKPKALHTSVTLSIHKQEAGLKALTCWAVRVYLAEESSCRQLWLSE